MRGLLAVVGRGVGEAPGVTVGEAVDAPWAAEVEVVLTVAVAGMGVGSGAAAGTASWPVEKTIQQATNPANATTLAPAFKLEWRSRLKPRLTFILP